jgi:hypothetical protein
MTDLKQQEDIGQSYLNFWLFVNEVSVPLTHSLVDNRDGGVKWQR